MVKDGWANVRGLTLITAPCQHQTGPVGAWVLVRVTEICRNMVLRVFCMKVALGGVRQHSQCMRTVLGHLSTSDWAGMDK